MKTLHYPLLLLASLCAILHWSAPEARAQATANPPTKLTYQGFLTDVNGVPLGDTAPINTNVIFRIFTAATDGVIKWSEQQTVTVDKGHFSVLLGEGSPVPPEPNNASLTSIFTGIDASDRFMEMTVGTTVMNPRLQFQPAPYAFLAQSARQIVDSAGATILTAGSSTMTFSGSVTATSVIATNVTATNVFGTTLTVTNVNTKTVVATNVTATNIVANTVFTTNLFATNITATTITATNVTATTFTGNGTIPIGGIIMWTGVSVPAGWTLCNGVSVFGQIVPDLRNRFIVGNGTSYALNSIGGTNTFLLTDAQVPLRSHAHDYKDYFDSDTKPSGAIEISTSSNKEAAGDDIPRFYTTRTTESESKAATAVVDNRPAYYALAFIMRVQ